MSYKARPLASRLMSQSNTMASFLERKNATSRMLEQQEEQSKKSKKQKVDWHEPVPNAIWIKNLRFTVTWEEVKDHMMSAGKVEYATIIKDDWGQPKGQACVKFSSEDEAKRALETMNETNFQDRQIFLAPWTGPMPKSNKYWDNLLAYFSGPPKLAVGKHAIKGNPEQMVYVSGLRPSTKYDVLKEHMGKVGTVEQMNLVGARKSAQVLYSSPQEAARAIETLNGSTLEEQKLEVDKWVQNWKPPEEPASGSAQDKKKES